MFHALIALYLFGGTSAQLFGLWSCPQTVKPMENFNASQMDNRRWYNVRKYPMMFTVLSQCPWAEYDHFSTNNLKVEHGAFYARQTIQVKIHGEAYAQNIAQPGKLSASLISAKFVRDYWVLGTDYKTFLVIYSCRNYFIFHLKFLLIFTDTGKPSIEKVIAAEEILDRNKLPATRLERVDRVACNEVDQHNVKED